MKHAEKHASKATQGLQSLSNREIALINLAIDNAAVNLYQKATSLIEGADERERFAALNNAEGFVRQKVTPYIKASLLDAAKTKDPSKFMDNAQVKLSDNFNKVVGLSAREAEHVYTRFLYDCAEEEFRVVHRCLEVLKDLKKGKEAKANLLS